MTTKKVPQIRFKGFNQEWEEKTLESISEEISYGLTIRPQFITDGIPLISARELKNGYIDYKIAPRISKADYDKLSEKAKGKKGDIFLTKTGTIGLSAYVSEDIPIAITQNISFIRITNEIFNHQFILQTFKTKNFYNSAISKVNQSTIMDLQLQDIRKLSIYFPDKLEQINVSNYFLQLDKLIEQKEKKYQKLKQFKKAMLDKMFPKNGADTPEIRFKGFSGKWEEKKLGELIEFIVDNRGKNPRYYCNEGIPVIDNFMIKNNYHPNLREATRFIDDNLFNNFIRKYVNPNDTIITLVGNGIGNITLVPKEKSVIIQNTLGLRFSNEKIFMFYCLLSKNKEIKHLDRGMAQPSIRQDELLDIEIKVPTDTKEQEKIGNYFQKLDSQIDLQQKELEKLKNIKKASLAKMFV